MTDIEIFRILNSVRSASAALTVLRNQLISHILVKSNSPTKHKSLGAKIRINNRRYLVAWNEKFRAQRYHRLPESNLMILIELEHQP